MRLGCGGVAIIIGVLGAAPARGQQVATFPDPIRLTPQASEATLTLTGLPGRGFTRVAVNIGSVAEVSQTARAVSLRYSLPAERFPQEICLIAWRWESGAPRYHLFRVPLLGRTEIPVRAWPNAELSVKVGAREFGPYTTGKSGRRSVTLLVEPSAREANVRVIGDGGLTQEKTVTIVPGAYNRITVAALPVPEGMREVTILVGVAEPSDRAPTLQVEGKRIKLRAEGAGLWVGRYPFPAERPASVAVKAALAGKRTGVQTSLAVELPSTEPPRETVVTSIRATPVVRSAGSSGQRGVRGLLGLGVGMVHNLGSYVSPSFTLEAGLDLRLPYGTLSLMAVVGASWASLDLPGAAPLEGARSELVIIPVGGAVSYHLPVRYVSPYLSGGVFAQIIRVRASAPFMAPDEQRVEATVAVFGVAGMEAALGPGAFFLQTGYRWSRLDVPDVALLAGGIVLDLGYRFYL